MNVPLERDDDLVTEALAAKADSPANVRRHRVIVRRPSAATAVDIARFAGLLRHELEHARQWECCGPHVGDLNALADRVLDRKIAGLFAGTSSRTSSRTSRMRTPHQPCSYARDGRRRSRRSSTIAITALLSARIRRPVDAGFCRRARPDCSGHRCVVGDARLDRDPPLAFLTFLRGALAGCVAVAHPKNASAPLTKPAEEGVEALTSRMVKSTLNRVNVRGLLMMFALTVVMGLTAANAGSARSSATYLFIGKKNVGYIRTESFTVRMRALSPSAKEAVSSSVRR